MKRLFVLIMLFGFILAGCATTDVCSEIPEGEKSVLCLAADKMDVKLDDIGQALKIKNIAGLSMEHYAAIEAMEYIDECDEYLEAASRLTYQNLILFLLSSQKKLSPTVRAVFIVYGGNLSIPELNAAILTDYDIQLLRKHLDEQRQVVIPFTFEQ